MEREIKKLILLVIAMVLSFPAWIWLVMQDWKLAVAILLILSGNNITNRVK